MSRVCTLLSTLTINIQGRAQLTLGDECSPIIHGRLQEGEDAGRNEYISGVVAVSLWRIISLSFYPDNQGLGG